MIAVLADENIPRATIQMLRRERLDISSVAEETPGAPDSVVLERARSEGRLLITFDRDFGELIYRRGHPAPPAVLFLRFAPATPLEPGSVLLNLLRHETINLEGRFTVATRDQVRQRPLP